MKVSYGSIVVACLFVPLFPFVEREIERDARYVRRGVGGVVGAWHDVCVRAWTCPASVGGGVVATHIVVLWCQRTVESLRAVHLFLFGQVVRPLPVLRLATPNILHFPRSEGPHVPGRRHCQGLCRRDVR